MKNIKNRLYFDSWRKVNEKLFSAYIICFNRLSKNSNLAPGEELVKALDEMGIRGKVTENDYSSAYTPARELGIYYNDDNGNFILGENAKRFINGEITYRDYMTSYIINYKALINDRIISPFKIIRDYSLTDFREKTTEQIFNDCRNYFSDGSSEHLVQSAIGLFLGRAVEAGLITKIFSRYKIADESVYKLSFSDSELNPEEFIKKYMGGSRETHENYVNEIINYSASYSHKNKSMKYPLNQILYGPPGTGKTYSTITKALDILGIAYQNYQEAQELFQNELGKRIEFVTMHQSFSYEDFIQGLKPVKSKSGEGVEFDYKDGVFKKICTRADLLRTGDSYSEYVEISNRGVCKVAFFLSKYNGKGKNEKMANQVLNFESDNDAFISIGKLINVNSNSLKNIRDKFDFMFSNREGYTARKGWTPRNSEGILDNTDKWPFQEIFEELNNKSFEEMTEIVKEILIGNHNQDVFEGTNENFVIILDEINRANISRVFGELIALIEKDKRDGKLTVTLPSGEPFTVPSNLYIIGTMNTADKSIALVDIALRRRFEFIPMYPQPELIETLKGKISGEEINQRIHILSNLNRIIRSQKSVDFEIGHSYFMNTDDGLIDIMNKQILPLLSEYFMYDLKKVKSILVKNQKDREGNTIESLGLSVDDDKWNKRGLLKINEIQSVQSV